MYQVILLFQFSNKPRTEIYIYLYITCNKFEVNKSSHWRQQVLRDLQAFWLRSLHEHLLCNGHDRRRLALPDLYILRTDISGLVRDR